MYIKIGKVGALLVVLTLCLFSLEQTALAQNNCLKVKGRLNSVSNGSGQTMGTVTGAGILNGTEEGMFTAGGFPTPDAATISFTRNTSITTEQGQLKLKIVGLFSPGMPGIISEVGKIDSANSTGRFAGATGTLFFYGKFNPPAAELDIDGEICFAPVRIVRGQQTFTQK